jgi:hypothetical protein
MRDLNLITRIQSHRFVQAKTQSALYEVHLV